MQATVIDLDLEASGGAFWFVIVNISVVSPEITFISYTDIDVGVKIKLNHKKSSGFEDLEVNGMRSTPWNIYLVWLVWDRLVLDWSILNFF
jgi:hypothetical protein